MSYPDRTILTGLDLTAQPGRRIGLIGENGVGKSTLLHAIAGDLPPRARVSGSIDGPEDVVLLTQEPPFLDHETVGDVLARTLRPLREAAAAVEELADRLHDPGTAARYDAALRFALVHDAWDADRRAVDASARLGLTGLDRDRRIGTLSGGERTRLAIATIVTRRPECVLLDEPTNHLDDAAIGTLERFIGDLPGVLLFSSHDRVFLDDVATDLIDLDPSPFGSDGHGGRRYGGGWTAYRRAKAAARRRWEEAYAEQQEELDRLRAATGIGTDSVAPGRGPRDGDKFIHAFKGARVDRTVARRKKDAERRLARAEREQVPKPPPPLRLNVPLGSPTGPGPAIAVRDLVVTGRLALPRMDVDAGTKLLVTGTNGAGKSTLLGVLAGRVGPDRGDVRVAARRTAELGQDPVFPDDEATAAETYRSLTDAHRPPLRDLGLLHPRDTTQPVGRLSVGQRRRLALAVAVAASPDLLLLDEPTNHISLSLVAELEEAIDAAPGTIVATSHDRWLRRRWSGATLHLG